MPSPAVRAVFFDAVGTLIHPSPPALDVYLEVGRRHGVHLDAEEARQRFQAALETLEGEDRVNKWRTSEERELRRWQFVVAQVFHVSGESPPFFSELWRHFQSATAWKCFDDVGPCLSQLVNRGLVLGIASNFDRRLRQVAAGLAALRTCSVLAISSEIGWRKPAAAFFQAAAELARVKPAEALLLGDDWENDYLAAQAAGWQALLLDRRQAWRGESPRADGRNPMASLAALPGWIGSS